MTKDQIIKLIIDYAYERVIEPDIQPQHRYDHMKKVEAAEKEISAAIDAALEEARLDSVRLDYMEKNGKSKVFSIANDWYTRPDYQMPYKKCKSLRHAIDEAMKEK